VSNINIALEYDTIKASCENSKGKLYICTLDVNPLFSKLSHFLVLHLRIGSRNIFIAHHFTPNGRISIAKFDHDELLNPKCWLDLDFEIPIDELDAVVREFDQREYGIFDYNGNNWIEDVLTKLGFPKEHLKNCGCGLLFSTSTDLLEIINQ
jgi:hypothetical protein